MGTSSKASHNAAASPIASRSSESAMRCSRLLSALGKSALRYAGARAAGSRGRSAISFTRKRTVSTLIPAALSRLTISFTSRDSS
jgi:hypothetical protein